MMDTVLLILLFLLPLVPGFFISRAIYRRITAKGIKYAGLYRTLSFILVYAMVFAGFIYIVLMSFAFQR